MPLSYAGIAAGQQAKSAHLKQVLDLLTGVMTDQAVTIANTMAATAHIASGLTGATAASRYGGATASGAPTTGTWAVGDFIVDRSGTFWVCTAAGTPGTWTQVLGAPATATPATVSGAGAVGTATLLARSDHQHPDTGLGVLASARNWSARQTFQAGLQADGTGSASTTAALYLSAANPYILSGSSYIVIPSGLFVSGGTLYVSNTLMARGGLDNDTGSTIPFSKTPTLPTTPTNSAGATGTVPVKLGDTHLAAAAASVTFSSISSLYRNLQCMWRTRSAGATPIALGITLNSDTGANYDISGMDFLTNSTQLYVVATGGTSYRVGTLSPAGQYAGGEFLIIDASSTTQRKMLRAASWRNDANGVGAEFTTGDWGNITAAVNAIAFATNPSGTNLDADSNFFIYGWP